ncbi:GerMN domain-containing protein [Desulfitobacterium sp.]|uniref:GerMN domain-containing protein n=1 Tax=Desulfitobacterium sp. TaxID=49981 RepID=UPI002C73205A|nr:GerMN domain-containing protein [Desulfitobacterium sp.]HVJ50252.1 GerMN domain-containing protein [Desulfitobacterium sp.]
MHLKKIRPLALILITILVTILGVTGCGSSNMKTQANVSATPNDTSVAANSSSSPSSNNAPTTQAVKMTLYFPKSDASGLMAVERTINVDNKEIIKAMFNELNNPPSGLERPLPKGTELLSATVKDGVATLDLSKQFRSSFTGGGTGEQLILYSIVNSLTTLPNVQSVQFLLNGENSIAILGETDTSTPLKRDESLIQKQ